MELTWILLGRTILAAALGAVLGVERARAGQSAGVRTNMMISVASCLFTFLSIAGFPTDVPRDTARVAAQIVSGVGFLGAGTVLQTKNKVRGLTTAATIWLVAAIGMTVGVGLYLDAIFVAIFAAVALILLAPVSEQLEREAHEEYKAYRAHLKEEKEKTKRWHKWWEDWERKHEHEDEYENVIIED